MKSFRNRYTIVLIAAIISIHAIPQQLPLSDQSLINVYDLSPAYAGHNNNVELFISYRKSWLGITGAPEVKKMSINGRLTDHMGLGGSIVSDEIGIFRSNTALLTYSYKVEFRGNSLLCFGLNAGIFENHIDISDAKSEGPDLTAFNDQNLSRITFQSDFGISYITNNLFAGLQVPRIIETKIKDTENNVMYTLKRHYQFHLGYSYYLHRDWELKPIGIIRKSVSSPLLYEAGAMIKYNHMIWFNALYRKNMSFTVGLGGLLYNKLMINYSYEFSGDGMLGQSAGTHEISLGVLIGNQKNNLTSIFGSGGVSRHKPYFEWSE